MAQVLAQGSDIVMQAQAHTALQNFGLHLRQIIAAHRQQEVYKPGRQIPSPGQDGPRDPMPAMGTRHSLYNNKLTTVIKVITNVFDFARSITYVNTFGSRLRRARMMRNLTQAELARACGLSQGAIGNYEADSRRSAKNIFRIADVLGVEPAWLAMGTGPMERPAPALLEDASGQITWPFDGLDPRRIWALSAEQRQMLTNALRGMVAALEAGESDPRV